MVDELLLFEKRLERLAADRERAARFRRRSARSHRRNVEGVRRGVRGGTMARRTARPSGASGKLLQQSVRRTRRRRARCAQRSRSTSGGTSAGSRFARAASSATGASEALGHHRETVLDVAWPRSRTTRPEVDDVEYATAAGASARRSAAPVPAQLREHEVAVDLLERVEAVLPHAGEPAQPILGELVARAQSAAVKSPRRWRAMVP